MLISIRNNLFIILLAIGVVQCRTREISMPTPPIEEFVSGDLVFRLGRTLESDAIAATAERPCRIAGNSAKTELFSVPELGTNGRSFGRGRGSGVRLRGSSRPTPGTGKFREKGRKTRQLPPCGKISPPEIYDIAAFCRAAPKRR